MKLAARVLKAIHAQDSRRADREKAKAVEEELHFIKLKRVAKNVEGGIEGDILLRFY